MIYAHEFQGRRPSARQVKAVAVTALNAGYTEIVMSWGENMIELQLNPNRQLYGYGWFKSVGGDAIAKQILEGV